MEFTLGRQVAGDGPDSQNRRKWQGDCRQIADHVWTGETVVVTSSPDGVQQLTVALHRKVLPVPDLTAIRSEKFSIAQHFDGDGPSMCIWLIRSKGGKVSFLFIEDTASYLIQWPAAYFFLHLTPLRHNLFSYILQCIWKWIQLGKLRGGDKKIDQSKNRSKWVEQCPYMVMLAVPQ